MRIDTFSYYTKAISAQLNNKTVIVVDVLRSTTSIICALMNGADKVVPVEDAGSAAAIASRLGMSECVLGGERGGIMLPGFDVGNSPSEYGATRVRGKSVVISTSNGTSTIVNSQNASEVYIGAMINRTAVAKAAMATGRDIVLMCSGTNGRTSADDILCAGAIAQVIVDQCADAEPSDMTLIALMLYADHIAGRADIAATYHYKKLLELGFTADLDFCFRQDLTEIVPEYANGVIPGMQNK